ncbi:MAG TPA: preprotein translocase subunit SecY [Flexilinea sp.]|jgi:preprotein translocase subunit SecY|nr:MAG: preprotein translocase subunit SecY [Chloroflexi bacterium ADurb.Bin344]HNY93184.1 preprotein translocase subunit SecY [Flexilinea sp.]HOG21033.1 preprotein translocase subunit SecY [Flexilinea sp.]HOR55220.1 preprotein translocase subunit SecY [Flexilinea sp.]HOU19776.1 preprotein translocase subunit SecY [Flexilinea sp.]
MKRSPWRFLWKSTDIRKKLMLTLGILVLYRLIANIPVPGFNAEVIKALKSNTTAAGDLISILNVLSGGTLSSFSIMAMGVYPYITASIILQLLGPIIPAIERKMKDDPREGQKWMEKWTMILTIPMAILSAIGQISLFNQIVPGTTVLRDYGWSGSNFLPTLANLSTMVAGTMVAIWLGQIISEYGIQQQGLSLIIFSGIVSQIPNNLVRILADKTTGWIVLVISLVVLLISVFAIVYIQQGTRYVKLMIPGQRIGYRGIKSGGSTTLPLRVNSVGMIPLIFAQSIITFPALIASFFVNSGTAWVKNSSVWIQSHLSGSSSLYVVLYFVLVVAFTYFYTSVTFMNNDYGSSLKKQGAVVPGRAAGTETQKYLAKIQNRITLPGAVMLGVIAVLPNILAVILHTSAQATMLMSSSGMLIVVGVVRDIIDYLQSELSQHGYEEKLIR